MAHRAVQRQALLHHRNTVESVFASIKNRGIGGTGQQRLKLVGDAAADWITSLAALHLTAARLAHETGEYAACEAEADDRGLFDDLTDAETTDPSELEDPGDFATIDEARRMTATASPPRQIAPRSLRQR